MLHPRVSPSRFTYGDAPAACYLKLALRKIIAPQCKTQLGREILGSNRYVDDVLSGHNNTEELFIAMKDMEETLEKNGSTIKKIISNELSYYASMGLLNDDGSTKDGKFEATDSEEICLHHRYNFRADYLTLCVELNTHPKNMGMPTGPSLAETDVENITVTKQVLAHLAHPIA